MNAFFERQEHAFIPGGMARSPWRAGHQNGLALGGLLAQTMLEAHPPEEMNIGRFTLDILRPAPLAPTVAKWRTVRDGRRSVVREGVLRVDGVEVARASALFVRRADEGAPATAYPPPTPQPEDAGGDLMMPLEMGFESRLFQRGSAGGPQRLGRAWVRSSRPIIAGTEVHPIVTAVTAADHGGALSTGIERGAWNSPNVDIAVHFVRPPRDEWVLVESQALLAGNGTGLVESRMSDRTGLFGYSNVTLFIAPTDPAQVKPWP